MLLVVLMPLSLMPRCLVVHQGALDNAPISILQSGLYLLPL